MGATGTVTVRGVVVEKVGIAAMALEENLINVFL
jgi:hypothetical protein